MKSRLTKVTGVSVAVVALLTVWEGVRYKAYIPIPGDRPTICMGETRGVKLGDVATPQQCDEMTIRGLREFEARMLACSTGLANAPNGVYVAALSLSWNIGYGAWCGSTMKKRIDAGQWRAACDAILPWDKAQGKRIQGLVNRRADERRVCLAGLV